MVLLIYPSMFKDNAGKDIDPEKDTNPDEKVVPFGILSVASQLAASGISVQLIDSRFYLKKDIFEKIDSVISKCSVIGFSCMTGHVSHALQLTKYIKMKSPSTRILWGGIHVTLFPQQTLSHENVDFIINGEITDNIVDLVKTIENNSENYSTIPGLGYKDADGGIVLNEVPPPADVSILADMDYTLLQTEFYIHRKLLNGKFVRGLDFITSRGCPYRCTFCVNSYLHYKKWRPLECDSIIKQIKFLVDTYKLDHIWFGDDYMFANKKRVVNIFNAIIESGINISWEANIRANNLRESFIDDETLSLMKKSGCYALHMGFESGSDRMLQFYKKDITVSDILKAAGICKKYDFYLKGFFIMGAPGESRKEIFATFNLIYKLTCVHPKYILSPPGIYRPYPGGELYEFVKNNYRFEEPHTLEDWAMAIASTGYLDPTRFEWIDDLGLLNDLRFYGRLLAGSQKHIFDKPYLFPVYFIISLVKLRFKYSFWEFRIEARLFFFLFRILKKNYRILRLLRIPYNI